MFGRLALFGALAAAAGAIPLQPVQAEFFSFEQMRGMCRGETEGTAQFRTGAGHRLLAETYRARCRMYLLGQADAYLRGPEPAACIRPGTPDSEVAEALVEALLARSEPPPGGIGAVVREALRARYGCNTG